MGGCSLLSLCAVFQQSISADSVQTLNPGKTRVTHKVLIVAVRTQIGSSIQALKEVAKFYLTSLNCLVSSYNPFNVMNVRSSPAYHYTTHPATHVRSGT